MKKVIFLTYAFLICSISLAITPPTEWSTWVKSFRQTALKNGISASTFDRLFKNIQPIASVIKTDRTQLKIEKTGTKHPQYTKICDQTSRVKAGKAAYAKNKKLIDSIAAEYKVDPCIIVALWGMESHYGRVLGRTHLIQSLATLAYDKRRRKFFTQELLHALRIIEGKHVPQEPLVGSWAGATGHPQFMPSSWYAYAIDHNLDGKKDIWTSLGDVFASMANYLHQNRWQLGEPISLNVTFTKKIPEIGFSIKKPVSEWQKFGVKISSIQKINPNLLASIVTYNGGYLMVLQNFRTLYAWNHSKMYVADIQCLAEKICGRI